jgi:hypothetical protein
MLVKLYGNDRESEARYSPAECIGCRAIPISGNPKARHISTSYVERQNLTMRMNMRRFHTVDQCVLEKTGKSRACDCVALHVLQFLPSPPNPPGHACDGSGDCRSRLVIGRGSRTARCRDPKGSSLMCVTALHRSPSQRFAHKAGLLLISLYCENESALGATLRVLRRGQEGARPVGMGPPEEGPSGQRIG